MKKALMSIAMMAVAALGVVACGEKTGAQEAGQQTEAAEAAVPDGFKTHEFAHFTISLPEEFTTTGEQDYGGTTTVRFDSEAPLKLENGEETTSSATIDCGFMSDGAKPANIKETAATMKASQEAAGETCDEPKIEGNVILMRQGYQWCLRLSKRKVPVSRQARLPMVFKDLAAVLLCSVQDRFIWG